MRRALNTPPSIIGATVSVKEVADNGQKGSFFIASLPPFYTREMVRLVLCNTLPHTTQYTDGSVGTLGTPNQGTLKTAENDDCSLSLLVERTEPHEITFLMPPELQHTASGVFRSLPWHRVGVEIDDVSVSREAGHAVVASRASSRLTIAVRPKCSVGGTRFVGGLHSAFLSAAQAAGLSGKAKRADAVDHEARVVNCIASILGDRLKDFVEDGEDPVEVLRCKIRKL